MMRTVFNKGNEVSGLGQRDPKFVVDVNLVYFRTNNDDAETAVVRPLRG